MTKQIGIWSRQDSWENDLRYFSHVRSIGHVLHPFPSYRG